LLFIRELTKKVIAKPIPPKKTKKDAEFTRASFFVRRCKIAAKQLADSICRTGVTRDQRS